MDAILFSSRSDEWETPPDIYNSIHEEFNFQIDLAATAGNTKCASFFSRDDDALLQSWHTKARRGWLNPPYSRKLSKAFIRKAAEERLLGFMTVMLIPARTDTRVFHECIYDTMTWTPRDGVEIRLLAGRVRFLDDCGVAGNAAPFPSMIVIFRPATIMPHTKQQQNVRTYASPSSSRWLHRFHSFTRMNKRRKE